MKHSCKVTVIDKKVYPELQAEYLADPQSGQCPCFEIGQEFLFERAWLSSRDFTYGKDSAYTGA